MYLGWMPPVCENFACFLFIIEMSVKLYHFIIIKSTNVEENRFLSTENRECFGDAAGTAHK